MAFAACSTRQAPLSAPAPAALPDDVRAYVDAAVDTLRRVSRHGNSVDWNRLRDSMYILARGARQVRDVYPVIDWFINRVDNHSFLQSNRFGLRDAQLDQRVAYVRVPFWGPPTMEPTLADTLQNMIRRNDEAGACRWIVDLRMNGGGNMWPMLAGIGPLLGDTLIGGTVSPRGRASWIYRDGAATFIHEDGRAETFVRTTNPAVSVRTRLPAVAVLIDAGTGSSGEAVAIAFKGRPNTRFFGSPTAGASTSNQGYRLPDGRNMVLTVGTMVDRNGRTYGMPVPPDEFVRTPLQGPSMLRGDPVIAAALQWLEAQSCDR
jgi:C-terminal processing protease CtpA/Prc